MAENSAIWLGSTLGDAASSSGWKGPYSSEDYTDILGKILSNDDSHGWVVPNYANQLLVQATTPASMDIYVETGCAFGGGRIYENTVQSTLTIAPNATGNPRIDRIVLRATIASQTIRVVVLQGTAAAVPSLPALTQTAATYEISLAYIWVANGAATIANTEIHDEREFLVTFSGINDYAGTQSLVINSEFICYSYLCLTDPTTFPPDYWSLVSTPSQITVSGKPTQMPRGRVVQITSDANNEGISQTFNVKASTYYTIKVLVKPNATHTGSVVVTTNSASPQTITRYARQTASWTEETIYYLTEADATTLTIQLLCLSLGTTVSYGQALVNQGLYPGSFREIHETLGTSYFMFKTATGGDGIGTYKTASTGTFGFAYSDLKLPNINFRHLLAEILLRDSGSAAGTAYIEDSYLPGISCNVSGEVNDSRKTNCFWVKPTPNGIPAPSLAILFNLVATGVNTADLETVIIGIKT